MERSEARYRAVFENQSVAIVITDEQNRIISWNSVVEELLLRSKNDLRYRAVHTLFTKESWKKIHDQMSVSEGDFVTCEALVHRKNKSTCDVHVSRNILRDKTGQLLGFTWILNDISKQKNAESLMRHHHELLINLMDTIPDSIYFKDEHHKFVMVNKAKAMHWGCTPKDMVGKSDYDYLPKAQAKLAFEDDSKVFMTGQPIINKIEKITDSDRNDHWFSVTKVPRYNKDGEIVGTIGISRDVTDWMVEQQQG
jgi:PAS domain S-box-containing protein